MQSVIVSCGVWSMFLLDYSDHRKSYYCNTMENLVKRQVHSLWNLLVNSLVFIISFSRVIVAITNHIENNKNLRNQNSNNVHIESQSTSPKHFYLA